MVGIALGTSQHTNGGSSSSSSKGSPNSPTPLHPCPAPPLPSPPLQTCPATQLYGYFYSLNRYGLMATALLDTSNTLLHAAKALNYADIPALERVKDAVSKSFALVFLGCRVILPPFSLIKPGDGGGGRVGHTPTRREHTHHTYVCVHRCRRALLGLLS